MLKIGRPVKKINADEMQKPCVVSSHLGMQNSTTDSIKIPDRMIRDPVSSMWNGKIVTALCFADPRNAFKNAAATRVMKRTILGNCILVSSAGITAQEIRDWLDQNPTEPLSWASVASLLPRVVELDDASKERKRQEVLEREREWAAKREAKRRARQPVRGAMEAPEESDEYDDVWDTEN